MNVTTLWYWAQNAAKTKKAVDVIVVGASGTIVKTTCLLYTSPSPRDCS